jgi:hypothetical protein
MHRCVRSNTEKTNTNNNSLQQNTDNNNINNNSHYSKRKWHNPNLPRRMTRSSTSTDCNSCSNNSSSESNISNSKPATGHRNISDLHVHHALHLACTTPTNALPSATVQPLGNTLDLTTNNEHDAYYDPSSRDDDSLPSTARGSSTVNDVLSSSDSTPDSPNRPNLNKNNAISAAQRPQNLKDTFNIVCTMSDHGLTTSSSVQTTLLHILTCIISQFQPHQSQLSIPLPSLHSLWNYQLPMQLLDYHAL